MDNNTAPIIDEDAIAAQAMAAVEAQLDAAEPAAPQPPRPAPILHVVEAEARRLPAAPEPPRTVEGELELLDEIAGELMALAGIIGQRIGVTLDDRAQHITSIGSIIDRIYFARQHLGAVRDRLTDALTALG